jgi:hypothetical protein
MLFLRSISASTVEARRASQVRLVVGVVGHEARFRRVRGERREEREPEHLVDVVVEVLALLPARRIVVLHHVADG